MAYTETTTRGVGSRTSNALVGMLFGFALMIGACVLLWWNEGRTVKTEGAIAYAEENLVDNVASAPIDPANQGKLIYTAGELKPQGDIADPVFKEIAGNYIRLNRMAEMFQWVEHEKSETHTDMGGTETTTTTYTYTQEWSSSPIESSKFKSIKDAGHNPAHWVVSSQTTAQSNVKLDDFKVSDSLLAKLDNNEKMTVLPDTTALNAVNANGFYYISADPANRVAPVPVVPEAPVDSETPEMPVVSATPTVPIASVNPLRPVIGDIRVHFDACAPSQASLISQQQGNTFTPFMTPTTYTFERIERGNVPASTLFANARSENTMIAWVLRIGGFLAMWIGFVLVFKPLAVLASVLPFLGKLAEVGIAFIGFIVCLPVSALIIAMAWIAYRPFMSYSILGCAVALVIYLIIKRKKKSIPIASPTSEITS